MPNAARGSSLVMGVMAPQVFGAGCLLWGLFQTSLVRCDEGHEADDRPVFSVEYDTVERRAIERQMLKDLNALSIGEVSQFHRHVVETLGPVLPSDVEVSYDGPLRVEGAHPSLKIHDQGFTLALSWSVEGSVGIFSFWISTVRTNSTMAVTKAGKKTIYVNLSFVADGADPKVPLKALGDRSVREMLKLLEEPPASAISKSKPQEDSRQSKPVKVKPAVAQKKLADFQDLIELIQREVSGPGHDPNDGPSIITK